MKKLETHELRKVEAGFNYDFLDIDLNNGTISIAANSTKYDKAKYWITLCLKPGAHDLQLRESDANGNPGNELLGIRTIYSILNKLVPTVFNRWWI